MFSKYKILIQFKISLNSKLFKQIKMPVKYDAIISYQWDSKPLVLQLQKKLSDYNLNIYVDSLGIEDNTKRIRSDVSNAINESQYFICALTKCYCNIVNANYINAQEIHYAYTIKKPFIVLILEEMNIVEMGSVNMLINEYPRFKCYYKPQFLKDWTGPLLHEILKLLKSHHQINKKHRKNNGPILMLDML